MAAGKLLTGDYYSADPFAAHALHQFDDWVSKAYPKADAVILTGPFISRLGPRGIAIIRDGSKPMFFLDKATQNEWQALASAGR